MKLVAAPSSKVPRACRHCTPTLRGQQLVVLDSQSSGDPITNRLGEFREIRESNERTGIAAHGHPAGTPGAPGVEREAWGVGREKSGQMVVGGQPGFPGARK